MSALIRGISSSEGVQSEPRYVKKGESIAEITASTRALRMFYCEGQAILIRLPYAHRLPKEGVLMQSYPNGQGTTLKGFWTHKPHRNTKSLDGNGLAHVERAAILQEIQRDDSNIHSTR
jgi:hypothetical protein